MRVSPANVPTQVFPARNATVQQKHAYLCRSTRTQGLAIPMQLDYWNIELLLGSRSFPLEVYYVVRRSDRTVFPALTNGLPPADCQPPRY